MNGKTAKLIHKYSEIVRANQPEGTVGLEKRMKVKWKRADHKKRRKVRIKMRNIIKTLTSQGKVVAEEAVGKEK